MLAFMIPALLMTSCLLVIVILAWGSFSICSGIYLKAICRSKIKQKQLALTFDDGPHPEYTPAVLDLLKKNNIKAGFFPIGSHSVQHEDLIKRIHQEGHMIGNHSYTHANNFGFWGTKRLVTDLRRNEALISDIIGERMKLFRPPFGVSNPNIARAARLLDYTVIGWSIRSLDGIRKRREKTIGRVIRRLGPGKVILFHDNHENIIFILEEVIKKATADGYAFVSPEILLNIKAYQ